MTKFAPVRVEGMTREVLGAKGVSPGCTADTRDHTDYPLTVCDRFHGETPHTPNDASTMSYSDVFTVINGCE